MSEVEAINTNNSVSEENIQNDKPPKGKKSKSPRLSTIERAREESEALTKDLVPEVEGRRRTRSAAKGVPATPPPPPKKEKKSNAGKSRGRPKKGAEESNDSQESETSVNENEDQPKSNEEAKTEVESDAANSPDAKEETGNNNAEAPKEAVETTENGAKEDSVDAPASETENKEEESKSIALYMSIISLMRNSIIIVMGLKKGYVTNFNIIIKLLIWVLM
ncbi:unnamed protein product [Phaedon cochleariae]|uniref:Uncharacterized protein n=1 Tax=Phaedon cochleariae TaxID=80249 RepID=A0A9N9SMW0_PHACE|nr:unnamed protein product [Phaedon cochleariae]